MNKTIITYKKSQPQKIGEKENQPIINVYLNRPTKYSVKKLEVKSVKQKNLFETAAVWRVSYFSVAMNNNFRNILSALNFLLLLFFVSRQRKVRTNLCLNPTASHKHRTIMNKLLNTYKENRPQKIGDKENRQIKNMYLNRPTKYSVKKLEVKSVKQKNLFEVRRFSVGVSYFSVAMNNNFRNILSALNFLLLLFFVSRQRKVRTNLCLNPTASHKHCTIIKFQTSILGKNNLSVNPIFGVN